MNMLNPYESNYLQPFKYLRAKRNSFLLGAKSGFYSSLIIAIPISIFFYFDYCRTVNKLDPATLEMTSVPLTNLKRAEFLWMAISYPAVYIVAPWTVCAAFVRLIFAGKEIDVSKVNVQEIDSMIDEVHLREQK